MVECVGVVRVVIADGSEACGMGVFGFCPSNPQGPCDGGDGSLILPSWEVGPFVCVIDHSFQPPCWSIFGGDVFPLVVIVFVLRGPYRISLGKEKIKVVLLAVCDRINHNGWIGWSCLALSRDPLKGAALVMVHGAKGAIVPLQKVSILQIQFKCEKLSEVPKHE